MNRKRTRPAIYVFEGPDGVGKSTLAALLHKRLLENCLVADLLAFPGREAHTLGEHVYRLYHNPRSFGLETVSICSEQLLFTAAHADVIENRILPALSRNSSVVLDRFWWSTWVHATNGGLDFRIRDFLVKIEFRLWRGIKPDLVFLIRRARPPNSEHSVKKWKNLVSLYDDIRTQECKKYRIVEIENDGDLNATSEIVFGEVQSEQSSRWGLNSA